MPNPSEKRPVSARAAFLAAVLAVAVATIARWLLDPWFGDDVPYITYFVAVVVAGWHGGSRGALFATALALPVAIWFFVPPRFSLAIGSTTHVVSAATFLLVNAAISMLAGAMHASARRAIEGQDTLAVTLASIGDAVVATDVEGRVTFLNGVAERLTGWTLREATRQPLENVFRIVREDTGAPVENPAHRALREGAVVGLANHTVLLARDGTARPIDDSASPIRDAKGRVLGCILVFRDVTERRAAEAARRTSERRATAMIQTAIDCVVNMDAAGRIVDFNPAAENTFGWRREEVLGRAVAETLIPERLRAAHREGFARFLSTGEARVLGRHVELPALRADGTEFPAELSICCVRDADGTPFFTAFLRDITARNAARDELLAADRKKDEFLATLAHELRNPLAPVRTSLEIMKLANGRPALVEQARATIDRQILVMERLMDDLLDVSRIKRNRLELRRAPIELASVVHQAVEACRPLAAAAHHEITVDLPAEPVWLDADAVRLVQVFSNLANNACRYTDPGGRIRIHAERAGDEVRVAVTDNGIGIPAAMLPVIFEMFAQGDRRFDRAEAGLGIGLTLVKQLVELHGGTVEARSAGPGQGSEFVVRLPVGRLPAPATRDEPSLSAAPPLPRHRFLIVDDNRDAATSLALLLGMIGKETRTVHDGLEAVAVAAEYRPDVVLLDIGLPGLNGYDVCRALRQEPWGRDLAIVALTGWGQSEDRRKSEEAGFDGHLVKPVDHGVLLRLLASIDAAGA